ncbi:MAG: succinate dehydrogenase, cytochrome b556 subunit [Terricaulis sp.]
MAGVTRPEDRPVSPFLTVWRWHVTMATSILHRVTGVGLYGGLLLLCLWLMAVAGSSDASQYARVSAFLSGPIGQIGMYLLVASLAFHLGNGIRHFVFDSGAGLKPADADLSAWFVILFAIAAPIAMWALVTFGV